MSDELNFKKFIEEMKKQLPSTIETKDGKIFFMQELLARAYLMGRSESKLNLYNQVNQTINALFDSNSMVSIINYDEVKSSSHS